MDMYELLELKRRLVAELQRVKAARLQPHGKIYDRLFDDLVSTYNTLCELITGAEDSEREIAEMTEAHDAH